MAEASVAEVEGVETPKHLLHVGAPDEIPQPPTSNAYKYSIDPVQRVVRADFSGDRCGAIASNEQWTSIEWRDDLAIGHVLKYWLLVHGVSALRFALCLARSPP